MSREIKRYKKMIENYLRNYKFFKIGIKNMQEQLDYIFPNCTATYEIAGGGAGTFRVTSTTEKYAIDRIESKRALDLHENIKRYEIIVRAIDNALAELKEEDRRFVELRYFERKSMTQTAEALGYSEKHIYRIRERILGVLMISLKGLLQM